MSIKINKTHCYVGEEILLTMTFKYKKDIQLYDLQFAKPNFENFWSKQINLQREPKDNLYVVQELTYILFPQKDGVLEIAPFQINAILPDVNNRNSFFNSSTKTKRIYSNSLNIKVNPLPNDLYLIGDFKINATIDKSTIKQGEAVSYKLQIEGRGNIDDIEEFNLDIPSATIYDNPSEKKFNIEAGKYGGIYKKSYSVVADSDFVIPALTLKYFDKQTQQIKVIKTKTYKIIVDGNKREKQYLEIKDNKKLSLSNARTQIVKKVITTSDNAKIFFFIAGFISACIGVTLYFFIKKRKNEKDELSIKKVLKKCTTQEELLKKVVPFINLNPKLDILIYRLESEKNIDLKSMKKELALYIDKC